MLDKNLVAEILNEALSTGGDYAEIFVENILANSLFTSNGKIKNSSSGLSYGAGIRIFDGVNFVYAYTNLMDRENLLKTAKKAALGVKSSKKDITFDLRDLELERKHQILKPFNTKSKKEKADLMLKISEYALNASPLVCKADANYQETTRHTLLANSLGVWTEDTIARSRFHLASIAQKDNVIEKAADIFGGLYGLELFEGRNMQEFAENVSADAISQLSAELCPSGKMDVVIGNGFGGVIFHEACGHGLEAEAIAKNASVFCGKMGQQVASPCVTAYDDATIDHVWGSFNVDDEGVKGQRKLLIENGILKSYMVDRLNGRRMGMEPNGCSRRQNYTFAPTSRMSNTFIANGKSTHDEIIANTEKGIYAVRMGGGSVKTMTGDFNFSVDKAFLIEKGKITKQVKGAKLIGSELEVLQNIDMVGNNMSSVYGTCSSISGIVPVSFGQPTIRVRNITVGGQK